MKDNLTEERAVARSMALLSTLSTAVDVIRAMRERRLGRDPSEQQDSDVVLLSLASELELLAEHVMALRASLVAREGEARGRVILVRHMNDLILIGNLSRGLHRVHQLLMSLYPDVTEDVIEEARRLHSESGALVEDRSDAVDTAVRFADDVSMLLAMIRRETRLSRSEDRRTE